MIIRDFEECDSEKLSELFTEFYSGSAVDHNVPKNNVLDTIQTFLSKKDDSVRINIIELDGQIAGYAILALYWSCEAGGKVVQIEEIFISSAFRNRSLGKCYFEWLEREYSFAKRFRLEVTNSNIKAHELYNRIGFKKLDYIQLIKEF